LETIPQGGLATRRRLRGSRRQPDDDHAYSTGSQGGGHPFRIIVDSSGRSFRDDPYGNGTIFEIAAGRRSITTLFSFPHDNAPRPPTLDAKG